MSATIREKSKPDSLTRELWQVAGVGDVQRLEQILAQGAEVNAGDRSGMTALMRAAYHGQLPMVRALVEHGADLNATDSDGLTALMLAKHAGRAEIVDVLQSAGAEEVTRPVVDGTLPVDAVPEAVSKSPRVRTLQDPPEIWELVHTTQPNSEYKPMAPAGFTSNKLWVLAVIVLIVGGGAWIGYTALRGSETSATANPSQRETGSEPATARSASNQPALEYDPRLSSKEAKKLASPPAQPAQIKAAGNVTGVRTVDPSTPVAAPVALPAPKPATKTRSQNDPNSRAVASRSNKEPSTPRSGAADSATAKKEVKVANQAPAEPPKAAATPKPKVIQWP